MDCPLLESGEKRLPVVVKLLENPLRDLARESAVVRVGFHELVELLIREVVLLEDGLLAQEVVDSVVGVLGEEASGIQD
jgi:hypothetical protein